MDKFSVMSLLETHLEGKKIVDVQYYNPLRDIKNPPQGKIIASVSVVSGIGWPESGDLDITLMYEDGKYGQFNQDDVFILEEADEEISPTKLEDHISSYFKGKRLVATETRYDNEKHFGKEIIEVDMFGAYGYDSGITLTFDGELGGKFKNSKGRPYIDIYADDILIVEEADEKER